MKPFAGIYTPIATPFRDDGTVDERALAANVSRWMTTPLTGLVVLGSNGEAASLEDAEAADRWYGSRIHTRDDCRDSPCRRRWCGRCARAHAIVFQTTDDDRRVRSSFH